MFVQTFTFLTLRLPVDVDVTFVSSQTVPFFTTSYWFGVRTSFGVELLRLYSLEILTASVLLAFNSSSVTSIARLTFA